MKLKNILFGALGVAFTCSLFVGSASAAQDFAICTPTKIGPNALTGTVLVQLQNCLNSKDPSNGDANDICTLSTTSTDQMMASILTAMSLSKPVTVGFDTSVTNPSTGKVVINMVTFNN